MSDEVIIAVITAVSAVLVVAVPLALKAHYEKTRADQAETDRVQQTTTLDFTSFMTEWGEVLKDLKSLMAETSVDRFLILRAWNGTQDPEWTTAVFQYREGAQEYINYVHFKLDTDYIKRLKEIENHGIKRYIVKDMPNETAIRYVYESEGVTEAVWCFLGDKTLENGNRAVAYCSFATHTDEPLSDAVITRCRVVSDRVAGLASLFG